MTIPSVVLSNTFNEFRTITNQAIAQLNALESGTGSIVADNVNANLVNASVALRANNVTTLTGGTLVINTNGGVNTGSITVNSGLNGNIAITPNGTGNVVVTSLNATGNVNITGTLGVTGATTFASSVTMSGGTANGVAYLNASKALTTGSALTFDGANLGVGTNSPATILAASLSSSSTGLAIAGSVPTLALYDSTGTTGTGFIGQLNTDTYLYNVNNGGVLFGVNNTEQMRLTSTGLGIGTSSPDTKLTVTVADAVTSTRFKAATGIVRFRPYVDATSGALIDSTNVAESAYLPLTLTASTLRLFGNNGTGATIDASGNLGLGVTPSAWTGSGAKVLELGSKGNALLGNISVVDVTYNAYFDSAWKYGVNGFASYYAQTGGTHQWYTAPSGTAGNTISFTQAMTLDASGQLIVGHTAALGGLNREVLVNTASGSAGINFSVAASLTGRIRSESASTEIGTVNSAPLIFNTANSERARISATGNFGIGVTNPGYTLDVGGAIQANTFFRLDSSGTLVGAIGYASSLLGSGGNDWLFYNTQATNIRFYTNNLERLRLDSGGNLGLGVTPSAWTGIGPVLQVKQASLVSEGFDQLYLTSNAFYGSNGWAYMENDVASQYYQAAGVHAWRVAAAGTAGANVSFTQVMTLDASGNLGIGTSSPASKLHVSNTAAATRITITDDVSNGRSGYIESNYSDALVIGTTSGVRGIRFSPDNTTRMFLDTVGNVGIGTTTPGVRLDVNGGSIRTTSWVDITPSTATNNALYRATNTGGIFYSGLDNSAGGVTGVGYAGVLWHTGAGPVIFGVNGAEQMRLSTTGLGIGANAPSAKLDVRPSTNNIVQVKSATHSTLTGLSSAVSFSRGSDGAVDLAAVFGWNNGGLALSAREGLVFATGGAVGFAATTERMRLDTSGNLGLGTSSPSYRLDVNGTGGVRFVGTNPNRPVTIDTNVMIKGETGSWAVSHGFIGSSGTDRGGFGALGTADTIDYYWIGSGYDSNQFILKSSGNVGIGTGSPVSALGFGQTASGTGITFQSTDTTFNSGRVAVVRAAVSGSGIGALLFETYQGGSGGGERMRLDDAGNLGIGTNAPGARLDVNGSSRVRGDFFVYGTGDRLNIFPQTANNGANIVSTNNGNSTYAPLTIDGSRTSFNVGGTEQMRLTATGLGIGTSTPGVKLDVIGSVRATGSITAGALVGLDTIYIGPNGATGNGTLLVSANNDMSAYRPLTSDASLFLWRINATERLRLDTAGNLGLGVTPNTWTNFVVAEVSRGNIAANSAEIDINHNAYFNSGWKYTANGFATNFYQANGSYVWRTAANNVAGAGAAATFSTTMVLTSGGNLGIGVTSPVQRLEVNGNIRTVAGSGGTISLFESDGTRANHAVLGADADGIFLNSTFSTGGSGVTRFLSANSERVRITAAGNVGIGDTAPAEKLTVAGTIQASEGLKLNSGNTYTDVISFTTSSTSQVTLQSVTAGTYRSGKHFVQITSGTSYQVLELTLLHDGANVYMSQYGEIATGSNLGTFDANIDAGNMNLLFTPVNAVTKVRLISTLVKQY